jgi:HEAT repeat protein
MKPLNLSWLLCLAMLASLGSPCLQGQSAEEDRWIEVLQSTASAQQKDAACNRLKRVGTAKSVPALAALLIDIDLSHSARYALESMSYPEAIQALSDAVPQATGLTRAGLLESLGQRRDSALVPRLAAYLEDAEPQVVLAAAAALGRTGGALAAQALAAAASKTGRETPARAGIIDALLACGQQFLRQGNRAGATSLYENLYRTEEQSHVRTAAYRGLIGAAADGGLALTLDALEGNEPAAQTAAVEMARDLAHPQATRALSELLGRAAPPLQLALVEVLRQRGDPAAAPALLAIANNPASVARPAALSALGRVGADTAVPVLLDAAATGEAAARKSAREALSLLPGEGVTAALVDQVGSAGTDLGAEAIRALGERADVAAVPRLLAMAKSGEEPVRLACFQALGLLAGAPELESLTDLILREPSERARAAAQQALMALCQRLAATTGTVDLTALVHAAGDGSQPAAGRASLLEMSSSFIDPQVRNLLRKALQENNTTVHNAAFRAMCDSRDGALADDLFEIVRVSPDATRRALAMRAVVRLIIDERARIEGRTPTDSLAALLPLARTSGDRRVVLAGLGSVNDPRALELALPLLEDREVRAEAGQAVVQIATAIAGTHRELAETALRTVLSHTPDPERRQAVDKQLQQIQAMADYITAWQVNGPYRQPGVDYAGLFDTVFPPESASAADLDWQTLATGSDPGRPWVLDLLKALGGEQCVAYGRTAVHSATEQRATLELGTDDGVKAWLNGQLVHANNTARPLSPGSDKAQVVLRPGWNHLLLKITQNDQGWEYCARLLSPEGARLPGLKFRATPRD